MATTWLGAFLIDRIENIGFGLDLAGKAQPRRRKDRVQEGQPLDGATRSHDGDDQAGDGMPDQDQVIEPGERCQRHLREPVSVGSLVVQGKVYRRCLLTSRLELADQPLPAPSSQASAMHQTESGHDWTPLPPWWTCHSSGVLSREPSIIISRL
jgi:hypothetical protein